ncbi:MAG: hypothetical protein AAF170_00350 [Bacteroidota bacterium]
MPETAPDLLALAIEAHGGADRWASVSELRFQIRVRGNIVASRGRSRHLRVFEATFRTDQVHARLAPYPHPGCAGVFDGTTAWIEDEHGQVLHERTEAERIRRRSLRWDDLDELYFFAYAFWNYTTTPFLLAWPGVECRELAAVASPTGPLRRLHARFPPGIPTHCEEQTFYFGTDGLLCRLDYTADVFGPLARGAHLCEAHAVFDGLVIPTYRRVLPRPVGRWTLPGPLAMEGWVDAVDVVR